MRPLKKLISLEEAKAIALGAVSGVTGVESLPLSHCSGRVLAGDVVSGALVPPFARSAMDGYAVRAGDTFQASKYKPKTLAMRGRIAAGTVSSLTVGQDECLQIGTGAPLPAGADAVVRVEDTISSAEGPGILKPVHPGENVARAGEDIRNGDLVLSAGAFLTPARIGAAAALGLSSLEVYRKPRALVFTTGDEIHQPGSPLPPGKVYDINSYTMGSLFDRIGLEWERGGNVPDDLDSILAALDRSSEFDLVCFSGGSSAGEKDMIVDAIGHRGAVLFHGIALKPGKPTLFGVCSGKPVFGIPGFPASCLAVTYLLVAPCARKLARLPQEAERVVTATAASKIVATTGRYQVFTVRLEGSRAVPAYKESGDITSMSAADGFVRIPPTVEFIEEGESVEVVLF